MTFFTTFFFLFAGMENFYGGDRPSSRGRVKNRMMIQWCILDPLKLYLGYILYHHVFYCHFLKPINSFAELTSSCKLFFVKLLKKNQTPSFILFSWNSLKMHFFEHECILLKSFVLPFQITRPCKPFKISCENCKLTTKTLQYSSQLFNCLKKIDVVFSVLWYSTSMFFKRGEMICVHSAKEKIAG